MPKSQECRSNGQHRLARFRVPRALSAGLVSTGVRSRLAWPPLVVIELATKPGRDEGADVELAEIVGELIAVCEGSRQHVDWAGYRDQGELLEDLRDHARRLRAGDDSRLQELRVLFLPSGPLQDIAIDSGWHDRYMTLASRFDRVVP